MGVCPRVTEKMRNFKQGLWSICVFFTNTDISNGSGGGITLLPSSNMKKNCRKQRKLRTSRLEALETGHGT